MLGDVWKNKNNDPLKWHFSILIFSMVKQDPTINHLKTNPKIEFSLENVDAESKRS